MMSSSLSKPKRPVGVTIIAIIAAAGGVLSLFGGVSVLAGTSTGPLILAIIVILFGFFGLALGVGFYSGAGWGWAAGVIIYVVSIGLGIAEILYGANVGFLGGIIRTIAGVVIPIYLTRQRPKELLRKVHPTAHPAELVATRIFRPLSGNTDLDTPRQTWKLRGALVVP